MKKIFFLIIFGLIYLFSFSQDNLNARVTKKDEKIFYNKNLPVYIWVSTDTTTNNNDILMTSFSTKPYANPMYLDTEGFNTFQTNTAADSKNKKSENATFKVYADGYPPNLYVNFSGKKKYTSKPTYKSGLKVKLSAIDYIAGVDKIMYSIDASNYIEYTTPIVFSQNGNFELKVYAEDATGNRSEIKTFKFTIVN